MRVAELNNKNVCILGFGREGQAMLKAIEQYAPDTKVTVADQNEKEVAKYQISNIKYQIQIGKEYLKKLNRFDSVIKSPGIKPCAEIEAVRRLEKLTNSTQFFLEEAEAAHTLVIGVTGSKGKSTTASLIHHILTNCVNGGDPDAETKVLLLGNIGEPSIAHLKDLDHHTICVLEMSSYQLMDLTVSPPIAVITSIFPEHLDYHGSFQAYQEAKSRIAKFQKPEIGGKFLGISYFSRQSDRIYFPENDNLAKSMAEISLGEHIAVRESDAFRNVTETKLRGAHNQRNIALACQVSKDLGISEESICRALLTFTPLPHRLQSLGVHHGIEWVDDAISTTPESTIAGIDALGDRITTIILGGQDRGNDFSALARRIATSSIRHVILIGQSGPRIKVALEGKSPTLTFHVAASMSEVVALARHANQSDSSHVPIVLLSTASPSYDMFKNFEEKGDCFAACVRAG